MRVHKAKLDEITCAAKGKSANVTNPAEAKQIIKELKKKKE